MGTWIYDATGPPSPRNVASARSKADTSHQVTDFRIERSILLSLPKVKPEGCDE
jgi:hypothetical protein